MMCSSMGRSSPGRTTTPDACALLSRKRRREEAACGASFPVGPSARTLLLLWCLVLSHRAPRFPPNIPEQLRVRAEFTHAATCACCRPVRALARVGRGAVRAGREGAGVLRNEDPAGPRRAVLQVP